MESIKERACHRLPLMGIISPKKLQKNLKLEVPKLGEVRVEARYIDLKPKKERVTKGIVIEVRAIVHIHAPLPEGANNYDTG
jgi:hypothetical protein